MKSVHLPSDLQAVMIEHAVAELPSECCGLLLGCRRIERVVPMRSNPPAPDAYYMDPQQQIEVFTDMEARGEQLLGIYHSHPDGPSHPSGMDLQLAFHPAALYFIISLEQPNNPTLYAFALSAGSFSKIPVSYISD